MLKVKKAVCDSYGIVRAHQVVLPTSRDPESIQYSAISNPVLVLEKYFLKWFLQLFIYVEDERIFLPL